MLFISKNNFITFLNNISSDFETFVPIKKNENRFYKKYEPVANNEGKKQKDPPVFGEIRAFEPLKSFFYPARERVADGFDDTIPASRAKPYCIVGVKACDLKGFQILDSVFIADDFKDPFYIKHRKNNLIISSDCTTVEDTCFCVAFHSKPYPVGDFDINISDMDEGYVVDTRSDTGKTLVENYSYLFSEVTKAIVGDRDTRRIEITDKVKKNIRQNNIPDSDNFEGMIEKKYDSPLWKEESDRCVECGACNVICPTCHCFLLYDQKSEDKMARFRLWDSCMIKDFASVAGGANPRPELWMRLRNRFEKKFDYFPKTNEIYACTGCGRCITACPAKIDIREVLKSLVENAKNQ